MEMEISPCCNYTIDCNGDCSSNEPLEIDLSYDSSDAIEEFTVEFQVNSFEVISNAAANG